MADLKWHCFEDPNKSILYCFQSEYGKENSALSIKKQLGFEYNHTKHIYSCWNSVTFLCQKYHLELSDWLAAEIDLHRAQQLGELNMFASTTRSYAFFASDSLLVYFIPAVTVPETYGATCLGCSEVFPYAVSVTNFKCWKCRNGG